MTPATPKTLERIRALLARAAHATTPEEEARTSAVQAARLIARHGLAVGPGVMVEEVRIERRAWQAQSSWWSGHPVAGDHGEPYAAPVGGRCQACKRAYRKGVRVQWRNPIGPVHVGC